MIYIKGARVISKLTPAGCSDVALSVIKTAVRMATSSTAGMVGTLSMPC